MNNIIAITVGEQTVCPHELTVVTEVRPDFLPQATFVQSEGRMALLYSRENLTPLARYGEDATGATLTGIFELLTGYIRSLIAARDMLLDTRLLSSDPEEGVFVSRYTGPAAAYGAVSSPHVNAKVKTIWGADAIPDEGEKICRIAQTLAGRERVMGAKKSMERISQIIRSESPSLLNCLKAAESVCREWNHIVAAPKAES